MHPTIWKLTPTSTCLIEKAILNYAYTAVLDILLRTASLDTFGVSARKGKLLWSKERPISTRSNRSTPMA